MVVRVFSDEVFEKIRSMNVVIRIHVQLTKTNEINVDIAVGSTGVFFSSFDFVE